MAVPVWQGDKLWLLLNEPLPILRRIFPEYSYNTLKGKKREWTIKLNNGAIEMPPRPRNYEQGATPEDKRANLDAVAQGSGHIATSQIVDVQMRQALHDRLDEVLDETNINPEMVKGFKVSSWDMGYKDSDGEAQTQRLHGIQLVAEAKDFEPKWDIVRNIDCATLPFNRERKYKPGQVRQEVIMPDIQIGYRRYEDGTLDPFHDEKAIDVALQVIDEVQPSRVIFVGDVLDLPNFSKYEQTPEFAQTTNASLEYAHKLFKTIRLMLPEAEIVYLAGNHEARLLSSIRKNLMEAYGVRRAGEDLPLFSIPSLLALDKLGVEYIEGYPAGRYYINPTLMVMHGVVATKNATSRSNSQNEGTSTISGHTHRIEQYSRTVRTHDGARQTFAYSVGTLSRIDGAVPSVKGSTDLYGRPLTNYEDWQNGVAVVRHDGKRHSLQQIHIDTLNGYKADFNGKVLTPRRKR